MGLAYRSGKKWITQFNGQRIKDIRMPSNTKLSGMSLSRFEDARARKPLAMLWQKVRYWITHKPLTRKQQRWELMKQEVRKQSSGR